MSELTIDRLSKWDPFRREAGGSTRTKQQWKQQEPERNRFGLAKQRFYTCITLLLYIYFLPSLHNNDVKLPYFTFCGQCAKKVVSHSLGLVDFAIGLVCSVFKLPDGQLKFFGEIKSQRTVIKPAHHATGSWNDFWAITCELQFAQMASCKTPFLFTLVEEVSTRQWLSNSFLNHDTVL